MKAPAAVIGKCREHFLLSGRRPEIEVEQPLHSGHF